MTFTLTSMIITARAIGADQFTLFTRPGLPVMAPFGGLIDIQSLVLRLSVS